MSIGTLYLLVQAVLTVVVIAGFLVWWQFREPMD